MAQRLSPSVGPLHLTTFRRPPPTLPARARPTLHVSDTMTDLVFFYGTLMSGFKRAGPLARRREADAGGPRLDWRGALRSRHLPGGDPGGGQPRLGRGATGCSMPSACSPSSTRSKGYRAERARHEPVHARRDAGHVRGRARRAAPGSTSTTRRSAARERIESGDYLEHLKVKYDEESLSSDERSTARGGRS